MTRSDHNEWEIGKARERALSYISLLYDGLSLADIARQQDPPISREMVRQVLNRSAKEEYDLFKTVKASERRRILQQYADGVDVALIAETFGLPYRTVQDMASNAKVRRPPRLVYSGTIEERIEQGLEHFNLLERIAAYSSEPDENGCINWTGGLIEGRGRIALGSDITAQYAYRVTFYLEYGWLPKQVAHMCDNSLCVNAEHLRGDDDNSQNMQEYFDLVAEGTRTRDGKLDDATVTVIREMHNTGKFTQERIAEIFGIQPKRVRRITGGKSYNHIDNI